MKKAMTIFYELYNNLYVNLTNKCPCSCTFCLRQNRDAMPGSDPLWLEREPTFKECIDALSRVDINKYDEVVFCGFGEPTCAFAVLVPLAKYIKENFHKKIRINTNGLGNLINERDITPDFKGIADTVSISLNTSDKDEYERVVRPVFKDKAYGAMLDFAGKVKKYVPEVILTTVDTTISKEDEAMCDKICREIGVTYRIRPWEK